MHFRFLQQGAGDGIAQSFLQFVVVVTNFIGYNFTNEIVIDGLGDVIFFGGGVIEFDAQVYVKPHALCFSTFKIMNANAYGHFVLAQT